MTIFGFEITRKAALPLPPLSSSGSWYPIVVREPYTGAWQLNVEARPDTLLQNPAVFRCVSLISGDIKKTPLRLVALDANGVWTETASPAFSPVLRRPNRYQLFGQLLEAWVQSKLIYGNTYVLKTRDARNVVVGLDVLDPTRTRPLIAPDGSVYYEVPRSELAGVLDDRNGLNAVPASEIIHDRMNCFFHPLQGIPPLYACAGAALQGLRMQEASTTLFASGGRPAGVLTIPGAITEEQADRAAARWKLQQEQLGPGRTAVVSMGATYNPITQTAVDSQLTEQQKACANTIAGVFGVPVSKIDSSQQPPYANSEASLQQYLTDSLQYYMDGIETCLDDGLELPFPYGTEFDLDYLILMDTATRTKAAADSAGTLSPNEIRYKYFGAGPVRGGSSPMVQQQYYSLASLADRDAPAPPSVAPPADDVPVDEPDAVPVQP